MLTQVGTTPTNGQGRLLASAPALAPTNLFPHSSSEHCTIAPLKRKPRFPTTLRGSQHLPNLSLTSSTPPCTGLQAATQAGPAAGPLPVLLSGLTHPPRHPLPPLSSAVICPLLLSGLCCRQPFPPLPSFLHFLPTVGPQLAPAFIQHTQGSSQALPGT